MVEEVKNSKERLSARRLLNLSPVQTALSQTMNPMNQNNTSKQTMSIESSLEESPNPMTRTFMMSSTGNKDKEQVNATTSSKMKDQGNTVQESNKHCQCINDDVELKKDLYRTQISFNSDQDSFNLG